MTEFALLISRNYPQSMQVNSLESLTTLENGHLLSNSTDIRVYIALPNGGASYLCGLGLAGSLAAEYLNLQRFASFDLSSN